MNLLNQDDRPIVVLDLEASALGQGSYPIEVGITVIRGTTNPIQSWSTLIKPTHDWHQHGFWSSESTAVHGIMIEDLEREGRSVGSVCDRLNALLRLAAVVVTDAPMFDQAWLDRLFDAACRAQQFIIYDFERLAGCLDRDDHRQFAHLLERSAAPHRAAPDALRLASAVIEARIGYRPQTVEIGQ